MVSNHLYAPVICNHVPYGVWDGGGEGLAGLKHYDIIKFKDSRQCCDFPTKTGGETVVHFYWVIVQCFDWMFAVYKTKSCIFCIVVHKNGRFS